MAEVTLNWNQNPAAEQIQSYNIYQDGSQIGTTPTPPFTIPGDVPVGVHEYQVSAVNIWGESALSAPAKTPPAASTPAGLSIQINVSVTVPSS